MDESGVAEVAGQRGVVLQSQPVKLTEQLTALWTFADHE